LRPDWAGCATFGNPVPAHAEHLSSVDASSGFSFFIATMAAAAPFDGDAGPVLFGDGAQIVVVVAPADAGADIQQSGLGAGHSLCRVVALSRPVPAVERFGVRCERYGLMSDKAIIERLSIAIGIGIARPGIAADAPARTPAQFVAQEY
jgi:hypothetical protein